MLDRGRRPLPGEPDFDRVKLCHCGSARNPSQAPLPAGFRETGREGQLFPSGSSAALLVIWGYINRNGVGRTGALPPSAVWEPFSEWPTTRPLAQINATASGESYVRFTEIGRPRSLPQANAQFGATGQISHFGFELLQSCCP